MNKKEKKTIYVVFSHSNIYGIYDEDIWQKINNKFTEPTLFKRFQIYRGELNGKKCEKLYYNQYINEWKIDK